MAKDRSSDAAPNGSTAQDQHYLHRLLGKRKTITEWGPGQTLSKIHSELTEFGNARPVFVREVIYESLRTSVRPRSLDGSDRSTGI